MTIVGLDPTSGPLSAARGKTAPRRARLDGVVIGLISNGLGESDAILAAIGDNVHELVGLSGRMHVRKAGVSVPPEPIDWERLINQTTVAVAGFGG